MEEKDAYRHSSIDDAMSEYEQILERLEAATASGETSAAERAGLVGELANALDRLARCAEEERASAEGPHETELAEARIAVLKSMRKFTAEVFRRETNTALTWN